MADSSLDDFFAKKDKSKKSKSKSKIKFTTTDTIAKKLEEGGKKSDIKKDGKDGSSNYSSSTSNLAEQDDEWKNIDDEKERDYSGLRIQALSISEREKEEEQLKEQMADQNGEFYRAADGQPGPWKIVANPAPVEEEPAPEPEVMVEPSAAPSKPMTYVPPALRNVSSSAPSKTSRKGKSAPEINSDIHFPSLSSAVDSRGRFCDSDKSFQSVKHGIRSKGDSQVGLRLDLENKFSALHQGEQN